ncbi:MAG TPA: YihY/virulence factor BrkB family protein [Candidatus Methylomirabilis sp.]|nr:YihY/virulence factor BrkB family protein [Candidatus Methylomirabilis sp.]
MSAAAAWSFVKDTAIEFLNDSPFQLAAALSFYTLLSLSPLVLVVVSSAGLVWGEQAVRAELVREIEQVAGPAGAETVELVLRHAEDPRRNRASIIVGIATLLFGATTLFAQLQASLNQIWNVKAMTNRRVLWSLIRTRLVSLALVLTVGFVLLVSLVLSAALVALHGYLSHVWPRGGSLWQGVNLLFSLTIITMLVAAIYQVLPDVRIGWRYVWRGALFTALLFGTGKSLIASYLGHASIGSAYGAAGSLVVFLVWVYYSSLILFLGAEMTQVYARRRGALVTPVGHAARTELERAA